LGRGVCLLVMVELLSPLLLFVSHPKWGGMRLAL